MPPMQRINQMTPFQRDLMKLFRGDDDYDLAQFFIEYKEMFANDFREWEEDGPSIPNNEQTAYDALFLAMGLITLDEFNEDHADESGHKEPLPLWKIAEEGDLIDTPEGAGIIAWKKDDIIGVRLFSDVNCVQEYHKSLIEMPKDGQQEAYEELI